MVSAIRDSFNEKFSNVQYDKYVDVLTNAYPDALQFRIAETPVFIDKEFKEKILSACEYIVDVITQPGFKEKSSNAVPADCNVPNQTTIPNFIAFDFGICQDEDGSYSPQLIEMQGFPTLFAFQLVQDEETRKHFDIPANYSAYLNGFDKDSYLKLLKEIIVGKHHPENVILLEVLPHQQKTRVDFYYTEQFLGIKTVCVTELIKEGNQLFYLLNGVKTKVERIYNRVIFDDLQKQSAAIQEKGKILLEDLAVEWVPHPNWFYLLSKYTLPFLNHSSVPKTWFLNTLLSIPEDLENYVLKPLFSFSGQGVIIDVTKEDIEEIKDPENWILQRKVKYADVIKTPNVPAKAEVRIFYFWKDGEARPVATCNLGRLSKGKMIGVRYNKDNDWVGGTIAYFEQ